LPRLSRNLLLEILVRHAQKGDRILVEDGRLVGLLSRSNVIGYLQVREELGISGRDRGGKRAA
ncbi:MAG TPA: hypothetical protein VHS06_00585, partial [Chloroflexota bacterium]|nr:hypothetical protein [Chloroflexota bacterium]